jgi:hypothetical protein
MEGLVMVVLPNKELVTLVYRCGHSKKKYEFVHEGHDIKDKLKWFKENVLCHKCRMSKQEEGKENDYEAKAKY